MRVTAVDEEAPDRVKRARAQASAAGLDALLLRRALTFAT